MAHSMEDLQLQRSVWDGHVPCVFTLAPDEVTTMAEEPPHAHYLLLPRHSYLPCAAAAVVAHFKTFAPGFVQLSELAPTVRHTYRAPLKG